MHWCVIASACVWGQGKSKFLELHCSREPGLGGANRRRNNDGTAYGRAASAPCSICRYWPRLIQGGRVAFRVSCSRLHLVLLSWSSKGCRSTIFTVFPRSPGRGRSAHALPGVIPGLQCLTGLDGQCASLFWVPVIELAALIENQQLLSLCLSLSLILSLSLSLSSFLFICSFCLCVSLRSYGHFVVNSY